MLQRIQSVWLFLAAACAFLTLKLSTYSGTGKLQTPELLTGTYTTLLLLVTIAVGVISLVTIFLYHNRTMQFWLVILAVVLEGILIWLYYKEVVLFINGAVSLTALLHPAVIVFLMMAAKGINADERLIKESSRLR